MKYPTGLKNAGTNLINYNNRGMSLESDINETNEYYLNNNIACIYKKPTPLQIVKVDYPSRSTAVIKEAYFKVPSTTDYNGLYKGKYIDFEAKETKQSYFPISNMHAHQIKHLKKVDDMGGIGFIIICFTKTNEVYLLFTKDFLYFIENQERKSIPKEYIEKHGYKVSINYAPRLDYLKIIDDVYLKGGC